METDYEPSPISVITLIILFIFWIGYIHEILLPHIDSFVKKVFKVEYKRKLSATDKFIPTILVHFPRGRRGIIWKKNKEGIYHHSYFILVVLVIIVTPMIFVGLFILAFINFYLLDLIGLA